ncbi:MAG: deoxyribose-phosphate aldolase [Firmicutes bacterium HGW-Firmicutes-14]|jgi:deoxyribose-phosphate aldolase|nr:MAG: deoxyribose-phosphate aldolase [Firmicutes bacterium HGW-Firmicutes-14]
MKTITPEHEQYLITIAGYIDHTNLKPDATAGDILRLCDEAAGYGFAAVCINPVFVPLAAERLKGTGVKVCTVAGFPLGANTPEIKASEARKAILDGAAEVDMVIHIGALKDGQDILVEKDISGVVAAVREAGREAGGEAGREGIVKGIVKVIIETCLLTDSEKDRACLIAQKAGAHFIKTSTGLSLAGATLEDVHIMKSTVGQTMKIKAAGGIRTAAQALEFIKAGAARIGTSSGVSIMKELEQWQ